MNASVQGCIDNIDKAYKAFTHNNKPMTKHQVLAVLLYAKDVGYETTNELKEAEIEDIIDKVNKGRFMFHQYTY